jgi:hypothetical protein
MDELEPDEPLHDFVLLSAPEMANFVLSDSTYPKRSGSPDSFDVVWDATLQDDTALGTFEIWSVFFILNRQI